jgi:hypothetical protein
MQESYEAVAEQPGYSPLFGEASCSCPLTALEGLLGFGGAGETGEGLS